MLRSCGRGKVSGLKKGRALPRPVQTSCQLRLMSGMMNILLNDAMALSIDLMSPWFRYTIYL